MSNAIDLTDCEDISYELGKIFSKGEEGYIDYVYAHQYPKVEIKKILIYKKEKLVGTISCSFYSLETAIEYTASLLKGVTWVQ